MPTVISGTTLNALTTVSWGVMSLFANNEQGVWFDPSDLNNYMSGLGPELVTNGDFSSGTGWTIGSGWSISGGTLNYSGAYNTSYFTAASNAFVAGRYYKVTLTISGNTSGNVNVYLNVPNNAVLNPVNISGNGEKTFFLLAGATCNGLHFVGNSATGAMSIDNISVKEVTSISSATMFQNAAGTTPVTAVEQPVGLILDKSKGLALGAEIAVNGSFASGTGWTTPTGWAISGGTANGTAVTAYLYQANASVIVNRYYEVTFTVSNYVSGFVRFFLGQTPIFGTAVSANGTYTQRFSPTINGGELGLLSSAFTGSIDNVSVKEVAGNHARQSTDASRPVLSARVNLLTYTEDFRNTAAAGSSRPWLWQDATVANTTAVTAPDGTLTADKIVEGTTNTYHVAYQSVGSFTTSSATFTVYARAAERSWLVISAYMTNDAICYFDLANGALGAMAAGCTGTITPVGDWYRCTVTRTVTAGIHPLLPSFGPTTGNNSGIYAGNGTSGIYIWGADLRVTNVGTNLPPYQRVGAATDYDTNGFPLYLRFDGVDDYLQASTYTMPLVERMTMIGMREISAVQYAGVLSVYPAAGNDYDSFTGYFLGGGDRTTASFHMEGTLGQSAGGYNPLWTSNPSQIIPTSVITEDKTLGVGYLRANGIQVGFDSDFTEFSANSNGGLIIGHRWISNSAWSSFKFNGNIYGIILLGRRATGVELAATEAYINSKTKAY